MRVVQFSEAVAYDLKEKVPALRGKIIRINDYHSGVTNGNGWSFQNLVLADPDKANVQLRVKVWNREEIPKPWAGKIVIVESVEGDRGPKGVTIEQDTYNWKDGQPIKKQLEVQCSDGAVFELANGSAAQSSEPSRPAQQNQGTQSRQQAPREPQGGGRADRAESRPARPEGTQRAAHGPGTQAAQDHQREQQPAPAKTAAEKAAEREAEYRKAIVDAGKFAGRKLAGMAIVMRAVDKLAEERQKIQKPLSTDQYQGICTTIFIAGDRTFQWDKLPTTLGDLEKFWPEPRKPDNQQESSGQ